jgi:predicted DNA-binding transcriptional regulator YafY
LKHGSMSRHLERLLQIDTLVRSEQRQTATHLAKMLEVSERTVRNDLAFLRDRYHAPIEYSKSKGWHYSDSDWRLSSISLSQGELFALTLGARMLQAYAGSVYQSELQDAIARLAERLPEQTWINLQQLAEQNVLFRVGAELDLDAEVWQSLEQACQQRQRVWIRYYSPTNNEISEREIDPYVLHFSRNNPYVTGFCHLRQKVRWFRVDRIHQLELRPEQFEIDPSFDRESHFADAFQHEVGGVPTPMAIWFDARTAPYIRERRWHSTQQIEEQPDESLILRFVVRGLNEVKRWVLFYGKGAKVLEPPELVKMVGEELRSMNALYQEENR